MFIVALLSFEMYDQLANNISSALASDPITWGENPKYSETLHSTSQMFASHIPYCLLKIYEKQKQ